MLEDWERNKLLRIFSNEIWELILEHIVDIPDYLQITSASLHFRNLLGPKNAVQILFPRVANILFFRGFLTVGRRNYTANVLSFRKTCRAWRRGLDKIKRNPQLILLFSFERSIIRDQFAVPRNVETFKEIKDFEKFEQHFNPTHGDGSQYPFISTGVIFEVKKVDHIREEIWPYYAAMSKFLQTFGHHILYCGITQSFVGSSTEVQVEFYSRMQGFLSLMPNLKAFRCEDYCSPTKHSTYLEQLLENELQQFPFPTLRYLQYVHLEGVPRSVVKGFNTSNPQIQIIQWPGYQNPPDTAKFYLENFSNLTRLAIKLADSEEFQAFISARPKCRIETLRLDVSDHWKPWKQLCRSMELHYSEHVKTLSLCLPHFVREELTERLVMRKLKTLHIEAKGHVRLENLLPITSSLENLFVETWYHKNEEIFRMARTHESALKLYRVWNQPSKSNLWSIYPNLKLLTTKSGTFKSNYYCSTRSDAKLADKAL